MQLKSLLVFVILSIVSSLCVMSIPILEIEKSQRPRRDFALISEKRQQKPRSGYIRFGKRQDPNAELLDLDQLLL